MILDITRKKKFVYVKDFFGGMISRIGENDVNVVVVSQKYLQLGEKVLII